MNIMTDQKLEEILERRDGFEIGSTEWDSVNEEKADYLESIKPSTKERIVYFEEKFFDEVRDTFLRDFNVYDLPFGIERRSALEYHPTRRHPIPYVLIRFQDKYFFILRESGGGELRLIGKKGLVGGHVGEEDVVGGNLKKTFENALMREAREEVGIVPEMIKSIDLRGFIKSDLGVDIDHLGLVYEIELSTDAIKSEENGVLTGIWISKEDLKNHYGSLENWSKIVYDNLLK
jgi:predicted NUDIX family phosphoesterase